MSLLLKSTGNYFSSSSNSFVENGITNFQVRALNSIVKVNYFQIYWWSATNDIIQSSINENKNKIAQIKWSTSPPLLTCLYYELLVSMEHFVQLIDLILTWSITLTCDGLKRALQEVQTDIGSLTQNKACTSFQGLLFYIALAFSMHPRMFTREESIWFKFIFTPFPTDATSIFYFHFLLIIWLFSTVYFQMRMSNAFDLGPSWPHFPPSIRHFPQSALSQCMTHPWIKHHWCIFNNTREDEVKGKEMHIRVLKRRKHQHEIVFWISDTVYKLTVKNMHFLPIFKNTRANSVWLENDFDWKEMCPHFDTWTVLDMRELPSRYGIRTFQIDS